MLNYSKLALPTIIVLAVGGIIIFLLAFNFYPEKHVNINLNGQCYEFLGSAYQKYRNLINENELTKLKMQVSFIENDNTLIPISLSGTESELTEFIANYSLTNTSRLTIANNSSYTKIIVKGLLSKPDLINLINDLKPNDVDPLSETIYGSIGIQSNPYISQKEGQLIINKSKEFPKNGLTNIINEKEDVKASECRSILNDYVQ